VQLCASLDRELFHFMLQMTDFIKADINYHKELNLLQMTDFIKADITTKS